MNKQKNVLILGISGMSGSHMADLCLSKGHKVYGLVRRLSVPNTKNISHILDKITLISGDLTDQSSLDNAIISSQPDYIFHFGAQSHVGESWKTPIATMDINVLGTLRLLESIKKHKPDAKMLNLASSEMFGKVQEIPQKETTRFYPRSIYACSKVAAFYSVINYRESYNLFLCNAISFNKESERRGIMFVTRKITDGVARIKLGLEKELVLGDLSPKRDWGYSPDYCEGFYLALQQENADDYVFCTGETHSVEEFVQEAFKYVGIENWRDYVKQDPKYMRPAEVDFLCGDYTKAKEKLGFEPKVKFKELVKIMMQADLERLSKEARI